MEKENKMIEELFTVNFDSIDIDKLKRDEKDLDKISLQFPKDGVVDMSQLERLAGLSMYGITICDYWVPMLMVVVGDLTSKKNTAKNDAYINVNEPKTGKLTADLRKAISEIDPDYLKYSSSLERVKALLRYFEEKRDSFKTFHFFMKDQQKAYLHNGGRNISGENLDFDGTPKVYPKKEKRQVGIEKISYSSEEDF